MPLFIAIKAIHQKASRIRYQPIHLELPPNDTKLADLITALVRHEVARYLALAVSSDTDDGIYMPMGEDYLSVLWHTGKVGFGTRHRQVFGTDYDSQQAKDKLTQEAIDTAILAFTDGLYVVFVDDVEITSLDSPITLQTDSKITLIRLTFLAGSLW